MPLYGSQLTTNSQLNSVNPTDIAPVILLNAETLAANAKSIAAAIGPHTLSGGPPLISFVFKSTGAISTGVFQIQEADNDAETEYTSVAFGGASPGLVNSAAMNANNVCKVTLQLRARFVRVLCSTAAVAPMTVEVSG